LRQLVRVPYTSLQKMEIRAAIEADYDAIWNIFHEIVAAGDTYAFDPKMSRGEALAYWLQPGTHTYVAEIYTDRDFSSSSEKDRFGEGAETSTRGRVRSPGTDEAAHVVGTYILRPNQASGGTHVANAAFMVATSARGKGIGVAMAEHCLSEARRMGFRAMQFNFVVSTNTSAIKLWKQLGFKIVGTLPGAFRHPGKGYVDVYVMFRSLLEDSL
jgi:ribosomal protein S18 acetylase RimI-like enzyme